MTLRLSFLICKRRKPQAGAHWAPGDQQDWDPEPLRTQSPACLTELLCGWFLLEGGWLGSCTWPASVSFCRLDEEWQGRHLPPRPPLFPPSEADPIVEWLSPQPASLSSAFFWVWDVPARSGAPSNLLFPQQPSARAAAPPGRFCVRPLVFAGGIALNSAPSTMGLESDTLIEILALHPQMNG